MIKTSGVFFAIMLLSGCELMDLSSQVKEHREQIKVLQDEISKLNHENEMLKKELDQALNKNSENIKSMFD